MEAQARERLRDRGLPQSQQYIDAELRRMQIQQERKMARAGFSGPPRPGGLPRAEAEEVVAETERDASGQFVGRHAGAVATTLAPKQIFSDKQQRNVEKPSVAGATWAADLIDARNLGAEAGYALVAVDIATRKAHGVLMNGKNHAGHPDRIFANSAHKRSTNAS